MNPPFAKKYPKKITVHNHTRIDDYFWLREKENQEVLDYLKQENTYTESVMACTKNLQEDLFKEMKARIKETDISVPVQIDSYFYYSRTEEGKQYPIYCRKYQSMDQKEQILLDQNVLAKEHAFLNLGVFEISPDHRLLAYSIDTDGSEIYTIFIKDLIKEKLLSDVLTNTAGSLEWNENSQIFYYTTFDDTKRPDKVLRHRLGTTQKEDRLLFEETDEKFLVGISKSRSKKFIFVESSSKATSEVSFFSAEEEKEHITLVNKREPHHEYDIDHHEDSFFIRTNDQAKNFKLMKTPLAHPSKKYWQEVVPHREDVTLDGFLLFKNHMVLFELANALTIVSIKNITTQAEHTLPFPETFYSVDSGENPNFDTTTFRFIYSSPTTPTSVYDYEMENRERKLIKQKEIPSGFDSTKYETKRLYATAQDGASIPISIVYRKDLKQNTPQKLWLTGYGAYGIFIEPRFSELRLSLLDRGFVFAFAHIRGGGDLGRTWYEQGKMLCKKNTFTDFLTCAQWLIKEGWTDSQYLVISGGSAGGLLMGAVLNMRPDLFFAAVAQVPFVDVLNTMLDETIPLTVLEYEEWGNPHQKEFYEYMSSYSPYDNIQKQNYPHLLVMAGLYDARVQYWEPAKWVAKLREKKTDDHILLLKTNMEVGHGGASGGYDFLKEVAFEYAFILQLFERE